MRRLDEGGDARDVGRRHRGAAGLGVPGGIQRRGNCRVDVLARRGEVDAGSVVGEVGPLEVRPFGLRLRVGARGGADLANTLNRRRDLHAAGDGTVLDRRIEVGRRPAVGRDVVVVHAVVARRGDNGEPTTLRVGDRPRRGLQSGGLLGVARAPVDPRVHRVGVVHDVHPVARRPHERTGHVLGVDEAVVVGRLNGDDGRLRGDAVDTNVIVVGSDNARDVRAVVELITPPVEVLRGNAVDRALHRTRRIDAPLQVGMRILNAGVNDRDGHGGALDVDCLGLARVHGDGAPVEDLLVRFSGGSARGLVALRPPAAPDCGASSFLSVGRSTRS